MLVPNRSKGMVNAVVTVFFASPRKAGFEAVDSLGMLP
jgi:hypothetical protein